MLLCRRTLQPLQPLLHRRAMSSAPPPPSKAAASTGSVIEITSPADFEPLVMAASSQNPPVGGPVIVDFYADWCEPCKQLTPALEKLVVAAQGAVRLAKVNVDNLPELASALQVKELPTVMVVHKGKLVESFKGGLQPDKLKEFVDRAVALAGGPASGKRALAEAALLLGEGKLPEATQAYADLTALPEHAASATAGLAMCALAEDPANLPMANEMVAVLHRPMSLAKPLQMAGQTHVASQASSDGVPAGGWTGHTQLSSNSSCAGRPDPCL
jgi:putative thioredoxin